MTTRAASQRYGKLTLATIAIVGAGLVGGKAYELVQNVLSESSIGPVSTPVPPPVQGEKKIELQSASMMDALFYFTLADASFWEAVPLQEPNTGPWKLQGIINAADARKNIALLSGADGKATAYRAGDALPDGGKLVIITDRYVVLRGNDVYSRLAIGGIE